MRALRYVTLSILSIAAIPPLIYFYGLSGFPNWITVAWGASLVIVGIMLLISVVARLAEAHDEHKAEK